MAATDLFHHAHLGNGELMLKDDTASATLSEAMQHQLEGWIALELTAEQMAQDELLLVSTYIATDTRSFLQDISGGLKSWELAACDFMLSAADPTQVEWQQTSWWGEQRI